MVRILIADDANLIRQALNIYFKTESDLEIVGTAENGKIALQLVEELNPDIVLMDMEMPEMDGLTATKLIYQLFPRTKVLIISSHNSQDYIDRALNVGANGYFIKNMPVEELSAAIKLIHQQNVRIIPAFSEDESYIVLPDSESHENQTESSKETIFNDREAESNTQPIEQEQIISVNTDFIESSSSHINSLQINRYRSKLLSPPRTNKISPYIHPVINKKGIFLLSMFSLLGVTVFVASMLKYTIKVRANAQIHSTSDIIEDWKKERKFANVGAVYRSQIISQKTTLEEKKIAKKQLDRGRQELPYFDNNLVNSPNQKSLVPSEDLITKVSSSRVPLLVKASVPSQDIAKVEKNQEVQLKFYACPYAHYGTLQGRTIAIDPNVSQPTKQKNTSISEQNAHFVGDTYEVTIEPARISLHKAKHKCQLKSGMKAKADIIIQQETILALILRKARLILL